MRNETRNMGKLLLLYYRSAQESHAPVHSSRKVRPAIGTVWFAFDRGSRSLLCQGAQAMRVDKLLFVRGKNNRGNVRKVLRGRGRFLLTKAYAVLHAHARNPGQALHPDAHGADEVTAGLKGFLHADTRPYQGSSCVLH